MICLPVEKFCDGVIDCPLGSDEAASDCTCEEWGLNECKLNGQTMCVYNEWVDDGIITDQFFENFQIAVKRELTRTEKISKLAPPLWIFLDPPLTMYMGTWIHAMDCPPDHDELEIITSFQPPCSTTCTTLVNQKSYTTTQTAQVHLNNIYLTLSATVV